MKKLIIAMAALLPLTFGSMNAASAKDMSDRFGLGAELTDLGIGLPGALNARYWFGDFGAQVLLGYNHIESGQVSEDGLGLGVHLLYNFARANDTNFYAAIGGRFGLIDMERQIIDLKVGVEHFLTDFFSIELQAGLALDVTGDVNVSLGAADLLGAGFHFYF